MMGAIKRIDLDADLFLSEGWEIEEHRNSGRFEWNASKVVLYLSEHQKNGKRMGGTKLRQELQGKPVLTTTVLDYLLANPNLIPDAWKGKVVFFWGTVYCDPDGNPFVRCLYCCDDKWYWSNVRLDSYWLDDHPAAVSTH